MTMTNNPTIDGVLVPRELLERLNNLTRWHFGNEAECVELRALLDVPASDLREHCKQCAEVVKTWPEWKRGCLGGEPVVERQPVAIVDEGDEGLFIDFIYGEDGNPLRRGDVLYETTLEVAALQSTIAQLQERIAELESGRGEPVAVVTSVVSRKNKSFEIEILDNQKLHVGTWLFTAPPAQVAVVLPERRTAYSPEIDQSIPLSQRREMAVEWNACLDATDALNGERK